MRGEHGFRLPAVAAAVFLVLTQGFQGSLGIRLEAVVVPQFKFRGDNATLLCKYELEPNEELFSLKWYKEETEFYRYTPPNPYQQRQNRRRYNGGYAGRRRRRRSVDWPTAPSDSERGGYRVGGAYSPAGYGNQNKYQYHSDEDHTSAPGRPRDKDGRRRGRGERRGRKGGRKRQRQQQQQQQEGTVQTWPVEGINISTETSLPQRVELRTVDFDTTGRYRCEVTVKVRAPPPPPVSDGGRRGQHQAQAQPLQGFDMRELVKRLTVIELPSHRPVITGGDPRREYRAGDLLNLTCVSAPSNPPSQLEWWLNRRPLDSSLVDETYLVDNGDGLFSTYAALLMPLEPRHFDESDDGKIRVKCLGKIEAEFWETGAEESYHGEKSVRVLKVMESQWPASANAHSPWGSLLCLAVSAAWIASRTLLYLDT